CRAWTASQARHRRGRSQCRSRTARRASPRRAVPPAGVKAPTVRPARPPPRRWPSPAGTAPGAPGTASLWRCRPARARPTTSPGASRLRSVLLLRSQLAFGVDGGLDCLDGLGRPAVAGGLLRRDLGGLQPIVDLVPDPVSLRLRALGRCRLVFGRVGHAGPRYVRQRVHTQRRPDAYDASRLAQRVIPGSINIVRNGWPTSSPQIRARPSLTIRTH